MKRKFFLKNLTVSVSLILIPICILGFFSIRTARSFASQVMEKNNLLILNQAGEIISSLSDTMDNLRITFEVDSDFRQMLSKLTEHPDDNYETLESIRVLKNVVDSYSATRLSIQSVYLYLENQQTAFLNTVEGLSRFDTFSDTQWHDSYLTHKSLWLNWSEPRKISTTRTLDTGTSVVSLFSRLQPIPAFHAEGVIVLNIRTADINKKLSAIPLSSDQYVLVAGRDGQLLFRNSLPPDFSTDQIQSLSSHDTLTSNGKVYLATVRQLPRYGWSLITLVPASYAYQLSGNLLNVLILALVVSVAIGLVAALVMTNRTYRRIHSIVSVLQSAENGMPLPALPVRVKDEYGFIIHNILKTFLEQSFLKTQLDERKYRMQVLELLALQSQINPHFLFNTLKTIYWKSVRMGGGPGELSQMVENLSDILYYSLGEPQRLVTLGEEIQNCVSYLEIQRIRYSEKFSIYWDYDPSALEFPVIKLILQPLLENSIYHGIKEKDDCSAIKVRIFRYRQQLRIAVFDNGLGMSHQTQEDIRERLQSGEDHFEHIGLVNVNRRLTIAYGASAGLHILSRPGRGTSVSFCIPLTDASGGAHL